MKTKGNLLSIGEMSKFTGAAIKSLRYYERIGILKPAYTDPDTGYRYYSLDQRYLIEIIILCIELDIPLKELTKFTDADDIINYRNFLEQGKKIAEKKMKSLNTGLKLINEIERKMDLAELYQLGQIYTRYIPEKYFHVKPCGSSLENVDEIEVMNFFIDEANRYANEGWDEWLEYGVFCKRFSNQIEYYTFVEFPKKIEIAIYIPSGIYYCIQHKNNQIENASDIFKNHIGKSYLAIETEIVTGKYKISQPVNELRVIAF